MERSLQILRYPDSELVLALVAPVGVDLDTFELTLQRRLAQFKYDSKTIRLSNFLSSMNLGIELKEKPPAARLDSYMTAGNLAREKDGRGDCLALYAAHEINSGRKEGSQPRPRTVHVLRSLKHPDEVRALRWIYGAGFFLIGVSASEEARKKYLTKTLDCSEVEAAHLIERDENEEADLGQKTRDTFQLADAFVPGHEEESLWRFLDLIFGAPFETPTKDEYAMFLAFAASLRSADLSRQVGAVIVSTSGEIIATGTNDVPTFGGGLYWPTQQAEQHKDMRDYRLGEDANESQRNRLIIEILRHVMPSSSESNEELLKKGKTLLKGSSLMNISEFGRAVHAEMEALFSCSRSGVSPHGGVLYTTTFPCHNCAKHIVASGITRVVYVEPYPKSQALQLHSDSIMLADSKSANNDGKVRFEPFSGVGPRRFFDLFSVGLSSGYKITRKEDGKAVKWERALAELRVPMLPTSYIEREQIAILELSDPETTVSEVNESKRSSQ